MYKNIILSTVPFLILCFAAVIQSNILYPFQKSFVNAGSAGLAGAGCAIPGGITAVYSNPALPNAYHKYYHEKKISLSTGYGRDSLFKELILPIGFCFTGENMHTEGMLFRYLKNTDNSFLREITVNWSAQLYDGSKQGAVEQGFNLRYEKMEWETTGFDTLWSYHRDSAGSVIDSIFSGYVSDGKIKENRLMVDVGFYQRDVLENIDFGVTFNNLFGYLWNKEKPTTTTKKIVLKQDTLITDTDTTFITTEYLDSNYYVLDYRKSRGRIPGTYRFLTIGTALRSRIFNNTIGILIPFDLRFIGLFDRKIKTRVAILTGIEVNILKNFFVRFGYTTQPDNIQMDILKNKKEKIKVRSISGGAGVFFDTFSIDFYAKDRDTWGGDLTVYL